MEGGPLMKLTLDDLTKAQQRALIDIVLSRGLNRFRAGYGERTVHAPAVVNALERRGLCVVRSLMGCQGGAVPTEAGWRLVKTANRQLGTFPAALR